MKKSFIVTSQGHNYRFMPEEVGYSVSEIGVRGVNTQGDSFEEALANAHEASRVMAEFRIEMKSEGVAKTKKSARPSRKRRSSVEASAV